MSSNMSIVAHNLLAINTDRQLGIINNRKAKSAEKLSSGYRVNRAADDAAGLAISEKMRRQIRGLTQASRNVQDGVSLAQTADGYLNEVHDMLHRITELSVQGANGTLQSTDREYIDREVQELKKEMQSIFKHANFNEIPLFHVPYTPEISGIPDDMQLFHVGNGEIGGIEFNNVRYNISELQDKGLKIDDNGYATEDFEAEFKLWDGETVNLRMSEGDHLSNAVRNYNWSADDTGIYINGKLSAEWSEVTYNGTRGLNISGNIEPGTVSFSHHGMNISFEIEETCEKDDLMTGINGDAATVPATWDVSVGRTDFVQSADIKETSSIRTLNVTESNKNIIDRDYYIVADSNGIAIRSQSPTDPSDSVVTSYVSWETFADSARVSLTDENGNAVATNGGYPIKNWGDETDGTGEAQITFDAGSVYHFTSPDSRVKIEFDFSLAESASKDEVIAALNGAKVGTSPISAPGNLTASAATSVGKTKVGSDRALSGSFELQRAYGRDFDNANATLTANLTVERSTVSGQPSESDTPGINGNYSSGHSVSGGLKTTSILSRNSVANTGEDGYRYYKETYTVTDAEGNIVYDTVGVTDSEGNPVYKKDSAGELILDEGGNPVQETMQVARTANRYYQFIEMKDVTNYRDTWKATDTWTQKVNYVIDGSLNGHDMKNVTKDQYETYRRTLDQHQDRTKVDIRMTCNTLTEDQLPAGVLDSQMLNQSQFQNFRNTVNTNGGIMSTETSQTAVITDTVGAANLIGISDDSYNNIGFYADESGITGTNKAFSFNYSVSLDQAKALAGTTGKQSIGSVTFTATDYAKRTFRPTEIPNSIEEAKYSDIKLIVPEKRLRIQSGSEKDHYIDMTWNPLNLTILGLSNVNTLTQSAAAGSITLVDNATRVINETRSTFGMYQNRFEHTIRNLDNVVENTQRAESEIRDTDMADEMVKYSVNVILSQAGQSMLAQANQSKQGILSLLE